MKICLVHEEYPEETNFGGIATYQKAMAEELAKEGHTVYVICRSLTHYNNYIENNVNIYRIFVENTKNQVADYIRYREKVASLLLKLQNENLIDIIEVPDWGAESILFEKDRKIPLVVRLHTPLLVWLKYNKNNFGEIKEQLLEWEEKMIRSADLITCCSSILKKIIIKEFNIDKSKIIVIPNPANITNFYRDNKIKKEKRIVYVGSLEERKGVCVLAKALNLVFEKYPDIKIDFIGKDTTRNNKNISTQKYIESIVNKKYKDNINFLGHIPNFELNEYLNRALVGVYPSLFDNFPYVVLESMATGLHIVGSLNSGMVEMLNDNSSIYKTGDELSLAKKIIDKYELSLNEEICQQNITRVKEVYNSKIVCKNMVNMYEDTLNSYYGTKVSTEELQNVLNIISKDKIKKIIKEKGGVANLVFRITTDNNSFIIKKYFYKYNFSLSNELYNTFTSKNIDIIKPINKKPINYRGFCYNIFEYKKPNFRKNNNYDIFFKKILTCERRTTNKSTIIDKFEKYYNYLNSKNDYNSLPKNEVTYVLELSKKLINNKLFKERYLNHGDISKSNIIYSKGHYYLIDFDETNVTTQLYDFAVVMVKIFFKPNRINLKKYNNYKKEIKEKYVNYNDSDFKAAIEFYLCKILLEKYYLHDKGIINLYSKKQLKDNYKKYLKMLKNVKKQL